MTYLWPCELWNIFLSVPHSYVLVTCEWTNVTWSVVRVTSEGPQVKKSPQKRQNTRPALREEGWPERLSVASLNHSLCLRDPPEKVRKVNYLKAVYRMSQSWEGRINKIGRSRWEAADSLRSGAVRKQRTASCGSCSCRRLRFFPGQRTKGRGRGKGSTEVKG